MSWTCPYCQRKYPDSSIGVPEGTTADNKQGCRVCWVSPVGSVRFARPDTVSPEGVLRE